MKNKKSLLIAISCALVALIVIIGCFASIAGGPNNPTNPTDGPGLHNPTGPSVDVTGPSGSQPGDGTEPGGVTDPTVPGTDPTNPTEPLPSYPNPDVGATHPTEPVDPTNPTEPYPTDPDTGEVIPTNPNEDEIGGGGEDDPYLPPVDPDIDIGDYTAGTITYEVWESWTPEQQQAFYNSFDWTKCTPDEMYNFNIATVYHGYPGCGMEGHYCFSDEHHQQLLDKMAKGCEYCGETNCASFYGRHDNGQTIVDVKLCPAYSMLSDPNYYCQECGYKNGGKKVSGETYCRRFTQDVVCSWCGEEVKANTCHHCVKP